MNDRWRPLVRAWRLLRHVGPNRFLRYVATPRGAIVRLPIHGHTVALRKGTVDATVALASLGGEFEILLDHLPRDFDGTIVDAGGFIGTSALALHGLFPNARIIVVEASTENLAMVQTNVADVPGIEVRHGALVGKARKTVTLRNRGTGAWGITAVTRPQDAADAVVTETVCAVTLSQLVADPADIGLLKLDIEGGEADLFAHDAKSLQAIGIIFAELHDRIVPGCSDLFRAFSKDRDVLKDAGEKYLSLKR